MNSKNTQESSRKIQTSPKNYKVLLLGIVSILAAVAGVAVTNVVQAEQTPPTSRNSTSTSQMMSHENMMMQNMMMAGEKTNRHFIEMMIPHHEGAVQMAALALKLSKRPEIRQLAESIKSDQTREIAQMKSWYKQWYGTSVPSAMMNHGNMMDMKKPMGMPMGMQNMMTGDLKALESAPDFDKAFIKEMIPHHKMALMMSSMVIDSDRPEMRMLSKAIVQSQSAEIEQMRQWYKAWYK